jgi:XTP/dITP diphosphohydrolase
VALPALARADKVLGRLARAGLEPDPDPSSGHAGLRQAEHPSSVDSGPSDAKVLGDALLQLVRRAREAGVDPEAVLRDRVRRLESAARDLEGRRG